MSHKLFVFGTLKKHFPNHHYIQLQTLIGQFITEQPYPLYLVGERYSPWMMDQPGEGYRVSGEVYKVDDATLDILDRLERTHSRDGYRRRRIDVIRAQSSFRLQVFCYLKPAQIIKSIQAGPLVEYQLSHADRYRSRD